MHYLLRYDYVDGMLERRAPHREAHLRHARDAVARGELYMAGATVEPLDGAVFVWTVESPATIEAFVAADPYVRAGLVSGWRIRPWQVVVGAGAESPA